ncbi:hypothetical protein GIB67_012694 [Kingdonia uniflora]|uniref:Uncharacterized protein n=1 Tax=Kingdonia uniflora TaxID=39325 RepID=A0A7J7NF64_9MAGN|nr:hypothetical protein GIB67_012694 [Kingdonia uniflora]
MMQAVPIRETSELADDGDETLISNSFQGLDVENIDKFTDNNDDEIQEIRQRKASTEETGRTECLRTGRDDVKGRDTAIGVWGANQVVGVGGDRNQVTQGMLGTKHTTQEQGMPGQGTFSREHVGTSTAGASHFNLNPSHPNELSLPTTRHSQTITPLHQIESDEGRRLEKKVALITGGARGIGECTAKLFCPTHEGKVIIADIQDELGHAVSKDVGETSALCPLIRNAGADEFKPRIVDSEKKDFERVLALNVTGFFLCTKHAARVMIPAHMYIVGAAASHVCACSIHAVLGLTRNATVELKQFGIRVNYLAPYALATFLATGFTKMGDEELEQNMCAVANYKGVSLTAEDVAQAALYLANE